MSTSHTEDHPEPPSPPDLDRRVVLRATHAVAVAMLLMIVVLALAGVFDDERREHETRIDGVDVRVSYPSQLRYHRQGLIEVRLSGVSEGAEVRLMLDRSYLDHFESVQPSPTWGRHDAWRIDVGASGGRIELVPARPGRARGRLVIEAGDVTASVDLRTTIFP